MRSKYAKVYPQILDSATATANGELVLNENVVNSFIAGKKAELASQIDAQIAQSEADKAVLMAKKEFAQAQLELAQAAGEGEGQISKEVAEYRIHAGNTMVEALIAMKMDEANAFFTNSQNATLSIASIAEQAQQTAAAVAGMANGVIMGSSNPVFYGSGGVYKSRMISTL